ncbi:MAG: hypothetical protein M0Z92_11825 [Actinomycetota bacterium]|nr:hypothetical protein [Actinomycetota bacterium]
MARVAAPAGCKDAGGGADAVAAVASGVLVVGAGPGSKVVAGGIVVGVTRVPTPAIACEDAVVGAR